MSGTPQEIVRTAQLCGMSGMDWIHTYGLDTTILKKVSDDAGLKIVSFTTLDDRINGLRSGRMEAFREILDLTHSLGTDQLMLPPFRTEGVDDPAEARKRWTEFYAETVPVAAKEGVTITLETVPRESAPFFTSDDILSVLRAVPGLKMIFDQGNMGVAEDPVSAFRKLKNYVIRFHLKDFRISETPRENWSRSRGGRFYRAAVIGEGDLDVEGFWKTLDDESRELYATPETNDPENRIPAPQVLKEVTDRMRTW